MDFPILIIWMSPLSFLGAAGLIFHFISFFDKNHVSKQNIQMERRILRRHSWGYSVCLRPIIRISVKHSVLGYVVNSDCISAPV